MTNLEFLLSFTPMHRRLFALLGFSLGSLLILLPQGASALHQDQTVCTRRFITLPGPTSDPFGYRYTEPLTIPGIGRQHRIAECDYIGAGGGGGGGGRGGGGRSGSEGEGDGGFGVGDGELRRRSPRIDYAAYIADLLRERKKTRKKPEVPRDREEELPVPSLVPSFMEEEPHDSDCDGFTDAEEHFLGSDPHDPLDPYVYEPYRKRTVSLDPRHPCFEGPTQVVMPKTGWERGSVFSFLWLFIGSAIACVGCFMTLLCRRHAAEQRYEAAFRGPQGRGG